MLVKDNPLYVTKNHGHISMSVFSRYSQKRDCDGRWLSIDVFICVGILAPQLDVSSRPWFDLFGSTIGFDHGPTIVGAFGITMVHCLPGGN